MTVEALKAAINELPDDQRHSLALWLNELGYDEWDTEMVKDFSPGGAGLSLGRKGQAGYRRGQVSPHGRGFRSATQTSLVIFQSRTLPAFWDRYNDLPIDIQRRADKQFGLFARNPRHPSIQLKPSVSSGRLASPMAIARLPSGRRTSLLGSG